MFYVAVCWIHHNQADARETDAAIKKAGVLRQIVRIISLLLPRSVGEKLCYISHTGARRTRARLNANYRFRLRKKTCGAPSS